MYSGPALRELTIYGRVRQGTGNFNGVLKGDLGVRTWHCVRQSPALNLVVGSWGVSEGTSPAPHTGNWGWVIFRVENVPRKENGTSIWKTLDIPLTKTHRKILSQRGSWSDLYLPSSRESGPEGISLKSRRPLGSHFNPEWWGLN